MNDIEAKLSVGSCTVRGVSSGELREMALLSRWKAEEFDVKLSKARSKPDKERILKAKAAAVTKQYYKNLTAMITKHNFKLPDGVEMYDYLASLSEDDILQIETAGNAASSCSPEELRDLPEPSGTEDPQNSQGI